MAIIDANTLAAIGLRQMLQSVVPAVSVDIFGSVAELLSNQPDGYAHYFVSTDIALAHRAFFEEHQRQTIVLTLSLAETSPMRGFHTLCVNQPEAQLTRQLLLLRQHGHPQASRPVAQREAEQPQRELSNREMEVMSLIVQGLINKEIAERLNIAVATVITHRKNIMEKLGLRSVSALTIYAVMHGYVDINKI